MSAGRLDVFDDGAALARGVAHWLAERAIEADPPVRIALSGGSTPKALFEVLAGSCYRDNFPWAKVEFYWGDERFVPHDHPDSNYRMAREAFLDAVPIPAERIHPIPTDGTPEDAARRYEAELKRAYGKAEFDPARPLFAVQLLGLGPDGHTASLLPGAEVLGERTRWVAPVAHGRPEARITLTYPALESSRSTAFLVTGAAKAAILKAVRDGGSDVPAARLRPWGELVWFADRAAAGR